MTQVTVFTSSAEPLTKIFKVVDGAITKDTKATLYSGTAETRAAATPAALLALLEGLTPQQALSVGVLKVGTKARITTANVARKGGGAVARTLEHFHFPEGRGWLLWDFDTKTMPPEVQDRITGLGGPVAALFSIWPEAKGAPYLIRPSSSGGVSAPGCPETQSDGLHGFFLIDAVSRSREALDVLEARAWAAGLAWITLSASGGNLPRSIVDTSVGSPERLVFEAPPILIHPVIRTPKPAILSDGIVPVPVPSIDDATKAAAKAAEAEARHAIKPEAVRVEAEFIEDRAQVAAKTTGKPIEAARRMVRQMLKGGVLSDDHLLQMKDGSYARVGDLLDAPDRYDHLSLPDPIEGVSYGLDKATLLLLHKPGHPDMQPRLVSHAHGATTVYRFERYERAGLSDHPASAVPIFDAWQLARVELSDKRESGLIQALGRVTDPAEAAAVAWTVAARLSISCPVRRSLGDVREFLDRHLPPLMAHPATLDGIVRRLAAAQGHRKARAMSAVTIPDDIKRRHRHEMHASLPTLGPQDWAGVIVIRAPMASGKTQRVGEPFTAWARDKGKALAICHRVSLVAELAKRLNLTHYGDLPEDIVWTAKGLATCLPSITKPEHAGFIDKAEFIFIDEVAQVLRFLEAEKQCKTQTATNADVWAKLKVIVARAKVVVVADAGVDRRTIEFLEECRPGEKFRIIEVRDAVNAGIEATYATDGEATAFVVGQALAELAADGKVWLSVEGAGRTKALGRLFSEQGYRVMAIHAGNKGNAEKAAFLADTETEARKYDIVIASPVIGPGLSVEHRDGEHFTLGGFIGGGSRITPADAAQMLRRVRYLRRFVLGLMSNTTVGAQDPDRIIASWEMASRIEDTQVKATGFDRLVAGIKADGQNARADFAAGLLWQLESAGWQLQRNDGEADAEVGNAVRNATDAEKARHRAALIEARILTAAEAKALERKGERTEDDALLLEAHRIRQALNVELITEAVLDFWDGGAAVRRLDRFSAAMDGKIPIEEVTDKALARRRFWKASRKAFRHLFKGIDLTAGAWLDDTTATVIMERVMADRHLLATLGAVGAEFGRCDEDRKGNLLPMKMPAHPVREVGKILGRIGLSIEGKQVRRCHTSPSITLGSTGPSVTPAPQKGNPRVWVYQVTPDSLALMREAADRRNRTRRLEDAEGVTEGILLQFMRGGQIDLNLAERRGPPEAELATADATETGQKHPEDTGEDITARACETTTREQAENTNAHVRRPDGGADGANTRVKGPITSQALPAPPTAAVIVALPPRPDIELSWPADHGDEDDFRVAPHMSVHGAELLIFRREPAGQVWDRARRAALWAGADHPREAGALR